MIADNTTGILAGLVSAVLFGLAPVAQAAAVRRFGARAGDFGWFVTRGWRERLFVVVLAAYLAGFVLHAIAIVLTPLYLAQATISLSLPITAWFAARRLGESLGPRVWTGVAAIAAGLVLLVVAAGAPGEPILAGWFVTTLWIGVAIVALVGRRNGSLPPLALAVTAGLGYAGSALAVRGVGSGPLEPSPIQVVEVLAAALAVPAYGLLAFWLYTVALGRSSAASVSGWVVAGQTLVPAAIGVLWLGDGIRPGWTAAALGGLVLSIGGALTLNQTPVPAAPVRDLSDG
ncbi:MAG: hypothetical protein ACRCYQ_01460 [Nocardioides sp.]